MKKALLIVSHGSRLGDSNAEVFRLTKRLRDLSSDQLSLVTCAFLEIAEPGVQASIDELVLEGATEILIFPHFLSTGTHVAQDIPGEIDEAKLSNPGVTFTLLPHLGALPGVPALILDLLGG